MTVFFSNIQVTNMETASATDREAYGVFFHKMVDNGVYLPPSQYEAWFISTVHTERNIKLTLEAVERSLIG
jgi:glutamate-1-semialdehyde 2,1-aminomutase